MTVVSIIITWDIVCYLRLNIIFRHTRWCHCDEKRIPFCTQQETKKKASETMIRKCSFVHNSFNFEVVSHRCRNIFFKKRAHSHMYGCCAVLLQYCKNDMLPLNNDDDVFSILSSSTLTFVFLIGAITCGTISVNTLIS